MRLTRMQALTTEPSLAHFFVSPVFTPRTGAHAHLTRARLRIGSYDVLGFVGRALPVGLPDGRGQKSVRNDAVAAAVTTP